MMLARSISQEMEQINMNVQELQWDIIYMISSLPWPAYKITRGAFGYELL